MRNHVISYSVKRDMWLFPKVKQGNVYFDLKFTWNFVYFYLLTFFLASCFIVVWVKEFGYQGQPFSSKMIHIRLAAQPRHTATSKKIFCSKLWIVEFLVSIWCDFKKLSTRSSHLVKKLAIIRGNPIRWVTTGKWRRTATSNENFLERPRNAVRGILFQFCMIRETISCKITHRKTRSNCKLYYSKMPTVKCILFRFSVIYEVWLTGLLT